MIPFTPLARFLIDGQGATRACIVVFESFPLHKYLTETEGEFYTGKKALWLEPLFPNLAMVIRLHCNGVSDEMIGHAIRKAAYRMSGGKLGLEQLRVAGLHPLGLTKPTDLYDMHIQQGVFFPRRHHDGVAGFLAEYGVPPNARYYAQVYDHSKFAPVAERETGPNEIAFRDVEDTCYYAAATSCKGMDYPVLRWEAEQVRMQAMWAEEQRLIEERQRFYDSIRPMEGDYENRSRAPIRLMGQIVCPTKAIGGNAVAENYLLLELNCAEEFYNHPQLPHWTDRLAEERDILRHFGVESLRPAADFFQEECVYLMHNQPHHRLLQGFLNGHRVKLAGSSSDGAVWRFAEPDPLAFWHRKECPNVTGFTYYLGLGIEVAVFCLAGAEHCHGEHPQWSLRYGVPSQEVSENEMMARAVVAAVAARNFA